MLSVRKIKWQQKHLDDRSLAFLMQKFALNDISSRIILARNDNVEKIDNYLNPQIRTDLPDPFHLKDMEKAANRIVDSIYNGEKIVVFGDYDVDGATSSALFAKYFKMIGYTNFEVYIPDRIKEGYGPNSNAFRKFAENDVKLIITVDCGTLSFEPIEVASSLGTDVIVIDHHLSDVTFPKALAIVNPNRFDETSPHTNLAAVGVSFLALVGINKILRQKGYFDTVKEPNLLSLLDIVALGTVCDVMTLTGVNRTFVAQGLKVMASRTNKGITALADVAGIDCPSSTYHLGYVLGPRINAGGRVGESYLGMKLLSADTYEEAYEYAVKLDKFNSERKSIEQLVLDEAFMQVEEKVSNQPLIFACGDNWHPGVIGIVCGRIKEKYNKPTAVISFDKDIGKASARSVVGVDIGAGIVSAKNDGLLLAGGGHAMAAGFTVERQKFDDLYMYLAEKVASANLSEEFVMCYDADIAVTGVNLELAKLIKIAEPYGNGNHEPLFKINNVRIAKADVLKGSTVRVLLADSQMSSSLVKAMAFRAADSEIGRFLLTHKGTCDIIGKISVSTWNGRESAEFFIEDCIQN